MNGSGSPDSSGSVVVDGGRRQRRTHHSVNGTKAATEGRARQHHEYGVRANGVGAGEKFWWRGVSSGRSGRFRTHPIAQRALRLACSPTFSTQNMILEHKNHIRHFFFHEMYFFSPSASKVYKKSVKCDRLAQERENSRVYCSCCHPWEGSRAEHATVSGEGLFVPRKPVISLPAPGPALR